MRHSVLRAAPNHPRAACGPAGSEPPEGATGGSRRAQRATPHHARRRATPARARCAPRPTTRATRHVVHPGSSLDPQELRAMLHVHILCIIPAYPHTLLRTDHHVGHAAGAGSSSSLLTRGAYAPWYHTHRHPYCYMVLFSSASLKEHTLHGTIRIDSSSSGWLLLLFIS